jgi:hypothetical protein
MATRQPGITPKYGHSYLHTRVKRTLSNPLAVSPRPTLAGDALISNMSSDPRMSTNGIDGLAAAGHALHDSRHDECSCGPQLVNSSLAKAGRAFASFSCRRKSVYMPLIFWKDTSQ